MDRRLQLLGGVRIIKLDQGERAEADRHNEQVRRCLDELFATQRVRALARVIVPRGGSA